MKLPNKQRGVALIVVLLIVAMIAMIATNINGRNQLSVRRTINLTQYQQAYWYAISAEALARKALKQDLDNAKDKQVNRQQYWAQSDIVFPVEAGEISGTISDMRDCFNLNALSLGTTETNNGQPKPSLSATQFKALLVALGVDAFSAEHLSQTLKDYVDSDTKNSPFGAEDADYQARAIPYRAANTLMNHRSELRAVLGFNHALYVKLEPYVCVIPGNDQQVINVNTIEPDQAVLLAAMLDNKISISDAKNVINQRPIGGYKKIDDFWKTMSNKKLKSDQKLASSFTLTSQYFLLAAKTKVGDATFRMQTVFHVGANNQLEVVTRQYGGQK